MSQINCFGILANRPQTYRPTHRGKKAGYRRMEKLAQLALRPDQLPTANLTTSTSNIANISTLNVHDESKLQLCVLNTQSMCNKSDEFVDFVLQNNLDLVARDLLLLATLSIIFPDQKRPVDRRGCTSL